MVLARPNEGEYSSSDESYVDEKEEEEEEPEAFVYLQNFNGYPSEESASDAEEKKNEVVVVDEKAAAEAALSSMYSTRTFKVYIFFSIYIQKCSYTNI